MTESFVVELIKQGGFVTLAAWMFWLYRSDAKGHTQTLAELSSRQVESATAWMQFGRDQGALMSRLTTAIERIEERLDASTVCPVTHVTTELLRDAARQPDGGRRRIDTLMRQAIRKAAVDEEPREGQ